MLLQLAPVRLPGSRTASLLHLSEQVLEICWRPNQQGDEGPQHVALQARSLLQHVPLLYCLYRLRLHVPWSLRLHVPWSLRLHVQRRLWLRGKRGLVRRATERPSSCLRSHAAARHVLLL
jgi:hypothetical protein